MKYFALTTSGSSPGSTQAAKTNKFIIYLHALYKLQNNKP